jgi:hypothetical protein
MDENPVVFCFAQVSAFLVGVGVLFCYYLNGLGGFLNPGRSFDRGFSRDLRSDDNK